MKAAAPRIDFITLLRGLAVLLVMWAHLVGDWLDDHHLSWGPLDVTRDFITRPLAIIQNFGFFGVMVFFFVSGFIITYVGERESRREFLIRRLLRIYPPLAVSIVLIVLIALAQHVPLLPLSDYLIAATLANYVMVPSFAVNGVAWSLVIEVLFYAGCLIVLPWLKSQPCLASLTLLVFSAICIGTSHSFGASYFLFAVSASYVPFLVLGQLIYFRWSGRISVTAFAALTALAYVVAVFGIRVINTRFYAPDNSYGVSILYAYLIFALATVLGKHIRVPRVITFTATISYSLYLLHGVIGLALLDLLAPIIGYVASLTIALVVVVGSSTLSYRYVEIPSQALARRLTPRTAE